MIKVITGIRRSGKSTLLEMFRQELLATGVDESRTQSLNLERPENKEFLEWEKLYYHIKDNLVATGNNYIFLDEIQAVPDFERAINGLFELDGVDLYITGSNAYFLSSQIATLLTGRYMQLGILPFSFAECLQVVGTDGDMAQKLMDYASYGSFPESVMLANDGLTDRAQEYIRSIFDTVLLKDVVARKGISDVSTVNALFEFISDSIGSYVSSNKIANYLTSKGVKVSRPTVDSYLAAFSDAFITCPTHRFDIKGKSIMARQQKIYLTDVAMRKAIAGRQPAPDFGHVIENIVYLELLRRYTNVWVGKAGEYEVDFVVQDAKGYITYYQVALSVRDKQVRERELRALKAIPDANRRYLITLDPEEPVYDGVRQVSLTNWLISA
ncbi:MAG: ATP-binding protein [Coriobacteriales bacterium]|nr:ATP-binding protein [Coriobacteriales bacterium]